MLYRVAAKATEFGRYDGQASPTLSLVFAGANEHPEKTRRWGAETPGQTILALMGPTAHDSASALDVCPQG